MPALGNTEGLTWEAHACALAIGRIWSPDALYAVMSSTTAKWQDTDAVDAMLDDYETWAVVGLSGNPDRTAYRIARLLQQRGKKIVPVHPSSPVVLGEQGYATLADVPFPIDVVDVFRRSEAAGQFADEAVDIGARAVWFQLGVIDEAAFERTTGAGLHMVMDTCPAIEWKRRGD